MASTRSAGHLLTTRVAGAVAQLAWGALLCATSACTRDVFIGRHCAASEPPCRSPLPAAGEPASPFDAAISGSAALSIQVQDAQGRPLEVVEACPQQCVSVVAVARGGSAAYAFAWSDGVAGAAREVCVQSDAELEVTVIDLAANAGANPSERAKLPVRAQTCAAQLDAGVAARGVCVANPSFEGGAFLGAAPPQWSVCEGSPTTNPGYAKLPASDGLSYMGSLTTTDVLPSSLEASLCAPLVPGAPLHFLIDLSMSSAFGPFGVGGLEIWGTSERCQRADLLWSSPDIGQLDMWHTLCGTLEPAHAYHSLLLVPVPRAASGTSAMVAGGYLLFDNLRAADSCPAN